MDLQLVADEENEDRAKRRKDEAGGVVAFVGRTRKHYAAIGTWIAVDKMLALTGQVPAVQVAVVNMPSEAEQAERRAVHRKLDALAAKLNA